MADYLKLSPPLSLADSISSDFRVVDDLSIGSHAIYLPVVIDFQGNLSKGLTVNFTSEIITILTEIHAPIETPLSIQFCFDKNLAFLKLRGCITSVSKEDIPGIGEGFKLVLKILRATKAERAILFSCLKELSSVIPEVSSGGESHALILSIFVTDNPHPLDYRLRKRKRQNEPSGVPSYKFETFSVRFSWRLVPECLRLVFQIGRDVLIHLLPAAIARVLAPRIKFAFIAHPRDLNDVSRKIPIAYFLPDRLVNFWLRHQWPVVGSYITGLKTVQGETVTGAMLFSPLTPPQMIHNTRLARKRVLQSVKLAQKMGAHIVGLGAFTSIVTKDGRDLIGKTDVGLTTGNPHSAAIAVQNVIMAAVLTNLSLPHSTAAIVGAAGSVGSACAKLLSNVVAKLILIDIKKDELRKLLEDLSGQSVEVQGTHCIDALRQADVIIAATNSPHILVRAEHLKPGAIVVDAAQPHNVSEQIPIERRDVLVIESAIVETPGVDCHFDLGLAPGEALGCLSETMILTAVGWKGHYSVGKAEPTHAIEVTGAGRNLGFRLAYFRNSKGYLTDEDLTRVANARITSRPHA
jgi:fatty aldehyde-generating acyl-ACP reductase